MNQLYLIGSVTGLALFILAYAGWHHHVFQQGYQARMAEEQASIKAAQPVIEKEDKKYEENVKAIYSSAKGNCGVDPAIITALDRLR